mmetsp:Transcript_970/g.1644  ORF Transcript_970/g.1644 Transcript_970/m.1644 type:complete len:304 (+) Transcript_970:182-1093(+)
MAPGVVLPLLLTTVVYANAHVIFVSWAHRLSVCVSLKAAYSQWRILFYLFAGLSEREMAHDYAVHWAWNEDMRTWNGSSGVCDHCGGNWSAFYNWSRKSQDWVHIHTIRDPFERLISGYLDKCVRAKGREHWANCIGFWNRVPTLSQYIKRLRNSSNTYGRGVHGEWLPYMEIINPHFALQSRRDSCGSWNGFDHVIRWGPTGQSLSEQVNHLCNNMPRIKHLSPFCLSAFPAELHNPHSTNKSGTMQHITPNNIKIVLKLYQLDYKRLQLNDFHKYWASYSHVEAARGTTVKLKEELASLLK